MTMMTPPPRPRYWRIVLLTLVALCPGQINFTALIGLSQTISESLGVSSTDAQWVSLLGNAALPLGYLVSLDLTKRVSMRRVDVGALALVATSSLCCALAPNLPALVAARIVQGFAAGILSLALIPPLLTFSTSRLPISIMVLVLGLFGASTLGPVAGGLIEQTGTWRELFGVNALLALAAIPMAQATVPEHPASDPRASFDGAALLLSVIGVMSLFIGIGELSWHDWGSMQVNGPVVLGVGALLMLVAVETAQRDPLLTIRDLARPRPLTGALFSCVGTIGFAGLLALLPQFLEAVRGLGAQDTGLLLWPTTAGGVIGAVLAGLAFSRPSWIAVLALIGLLLLGITAWILKGLTAYMGDNSIMLIAAMLGLGASVSVAPGMMLAALSVPQRRLGSTLAVVTLLRESLQGVSGSSLTHFIRAQSNIHDAHLLWQKGFNRLFTALAAQGQPTNTSDQTLTNLALVLGMTDAAVVVMLIVVLGAALAVTVQLLGRSAPVEGVI